jgi:hypothetical protein
MNFLQLISNLTAACLWDRPAGFWNEHCYKSGVADRGRRDWYMSSSFNPIVMIAWLLAGLLACPQSLPAQTTSAQTLGKVQPKPDNRIAAVQCPEADGQADPASANGGDPFVDAENTWAKRGGVATTVTGAVSTGIGGGILFLRKHALNKLAQSQGAQNAIKDYLSVYGPYQRKLDDLRAKFGKDLTKPQRAALGFKYKGQIKEVKDMQKVLEAKAGAIGGFADSRAVLRNLTAREKFAAFTEAEVQNWTKVSSRLNRPGFVTKAKIAAGAGVAAIVFGVFVYFYADDLDSFFSGPEFVEDGKPLDLKGGEEAVTAAILKKLDCAGSQQDTVEVPVRGEEQGLQPEYRGMAVGGGQ